jgi:hypothetical protein
VVVGYSRGKFSDLFYPPYRLEIAPRASSDEPPITINFKVLSRLDARRLVEVLDLRCTRAIRYIKASF